MPYSRKRLLESTGIGTTIRRARESAKRSQESLAAAVGIEPASLSHIELGSDVKASTLLRILAALDLTIVVAPAAAESQIRAVTEDVLADEDAERGSRP